MRGIELEIYTESKKWQSCSLNTFNNMVLHADTIITENGVPFTDIKYYKQGFFNSRSYLLHKIIGGKQYGI